MTIRAIAILAAAGLLAAAPLRAQPHGGDSAAAGTVPSPALPAPMAQRLMTAADSAALDRVTREVSSELRCPVCQGESIQESPSELAQELKAVVREQLAAGRTPSEVKQYFVARYGEWILLKPTTTGFNAMLYVLPPLALIAGIALVVVIARRWTHAPAAPTPSTISSDDVR